jgi:hypothetical protein
MIYFSGLPIVLQLRHSLHWIPDVVTIPGCLCNASLHICPCPTKNPYQPNQHKHSHSHTAISGTTSRRRFQTTEPSSPSIQFDQRCEHNPTSKPVGYCTRAATSQNGWIPCGQSLLNIFLASHCGLRLVHSPFLERYAIATSVNAYGGKSVPMSGLGCPNTVANTRPVWYILYTLQLSPSGSWTCLQRSDSKSMVLRLRQVPLTRLSRFWSSSTTVQNPSS